MEGPDDGDEYSAEYLKPSYKLIREKWVELRSIQHCAGCNVELAHKESARYRVYTVGGEFLTEYHCLRCTSEGNGGRRRI
jgi:hypothetical protein